MNPGIEAVRKLAHIGYRLHLEGESIRLRYEGQDAPDPDQVRPLLVVVKAHKPEVLAHLSKPALPERILSCTDCSFHEYQGPNPAHGWGRCAFKGKWCYGLRQACNECKENDG
jgi:hypothetical protein